MAGWNEYPACRNPGLLSLIPPSMAGWNEYPAYSVWSRRLWHVGMSTRPKLGSKQTDTSRDTPARICSLAVWCWCLAERTASGDKLRLTGSGSASQACSRRCAIAYKSTVTEVQNCMLIFNCMSIQECVAKRKCKFLANYVKSYNILCYVSVCQNSAAHELNMLGKRWLFHFLQ